MGEAWHVIIGGQGRGFATAVGRGDAAHEIVVV